MERCRVLIADDNVRARAGLRALLALRQEIEFAGEAADGGEAVQMVRECQPDVVLMDVRMPSMDGLGATWRIKGLWSAIRVVVATMYTSHRAQAFAAGADGFLRKGCPVDELLAAVLEDRQRKHKDRMIRKTEEVSK